MAQSTVYLFIDVVECFALKKHRLLPASGREIGILGVGKLHHLTKIASSNGKSNSRIVPNCAPAVVAIISADGEEDKPMTEGEALNFFSAQFAAIKQRNGMQISLTNSGNGIVIYIWLIK